MAAASRCSDSCLKGPDALALSTALDGLSDRGTAFKIPVSDSTGRKLQARGRAVGSMAAVWLEETAVEAASADFRAILDALPIPVWLRDKGLALNWGNHAFLKSAGVKDVAAARAAHTALDKSERELAASARAQNRVVETRRFAIVGGQRRAVTFTEIPLGDAGIIGTAVDVTDVAAAEARLQQHVDAHVDTLDKLATAVAIFGPDQKLSFYNRAFVRLWGLPEDWLERHPGDGEFLDRLREMRRLPEQRDYQAWKRGRLALYQTARDRATEELWHLPGGQTLRVVSQPHPFGGLTFLFEDVSEKLQSGIQLQHPDQGPVGDPGHADGRRGRVRPRRAAETAQRRLRPHLGSGCGGIAGRAAYPRHRRPGRRQVRRCGDVGQPDRSHHLGSAASPATWAKSSAATAPSCRCICRRCRTAPAW